MGSHLLLAHPAWWWLENRRMSKEEVAAHMVNLAWNGLKAMEPRPQLREHADSGDDEATSTGQ